MRHDPMLERSALFVATLTSFVAPFMISAVNVALPAIQAEWTVGAIGLRWISTAYLLATAVILLPAGKLADICGRKKVFTTGLCLYTVASTSAAFVPSIAWLIGMRVLQGFGAAMFITAGMAILTSVFPPQRRGRAIGFYVAADGKADGASGLRRIAFSRPSSRCLFQHRRPHQLLGHICPHLPDQPLPSISELDCR